jgi:outer membrane exchange protein TraA
MLLAVLSVVCTLSVVRADPVVLSGGPIAPAPATVSGGQGLVVAFAPVADAVTEIGASATPGDFTSRVWGVIGAKTNARGGVLTLLDRSNQNSTGLQSSYGDFIGSVPGCPAPGCSFEGAPTTEPLASTSSWASGYRGYLVVSADLVGRDVHIAVRGDDGFELTVCDQIGCHLVIERGLSYGTTSWRYSRTVRFPSAGLYPVEVGYAEVAEHAALEVSAFVGPFADVAGPVSSTQSFASAGFTLLGPERFLQTEDGLASVQSRLCPRSDTGHVSPDCPPSSYCNRAAVCAPCTTVDACGSECQPCGPNNANCSAAGTGYVCNAAPPPPSGCSLSGHRPSGAWVGFFLLGLALTVMLVRGRRARGGIAALLLFTAMGGVSHADPDPRIERMRWRKQPANICPAGEIAYCSRSACRPLDRNKTDATVACVCHERDPRFAPQPDADICGTAANNERCQACCIAHYVCGERDTGSDP